MKYYTIQSNHRDIRPIIKFIFHDNNHKFQLNVSLLRIPCKDTILWYQASFTIYLVLKLVVYATFLLLY